MNMINELESIESFDVLVQSVTKALIDKSVFKWKIPEDFDALLAALVRLGSDENTLRLLALLGRAEAAVKKDLFDLEQASDLLFASPDLSVLKDGDDRYYAAQIVKRFDPKSIYPWAVANVWAEPGAEKARLVFLEILLGKAANFEIMLADLGKAGQEYVKDNSLRESKAVARTLRVIKTLRAACQSRDINCSIMVGESVDAFIGAPFSHFTIKQTNAGARKNLVPAVAGLLLDLIGQRFSLAIEAEHYTALKRLRKWCNDEVLRELWLKNPAIEKLSNTIAEALVILARQDITDGELLNRLRDSVYSEYRFKSYCQSIAETGKLDESIAAWLMAGGERQQFKKTISSNDDVAVKIESDYIGEMLLQAEQGQSAVSMAEGALDDLELFDPSLIPVIKDITHHWAIVREIAAKMAGNRSIKLIGESEEIVEIDRKLFELVEEASVSQRYGIVVRSAVVASIGGKTQAMKKGIVNIVEK